MKKQYVNTDPCCHKWGCHCRLNEKNQCKVCEQKDKAHNEKQNI
jgi:hypothetical protein